MIREKIKHKIQNFKNHQGFRRYFKNTSWMLLGHIFSILTSFFIGTWIARYFGPKEYGNISYILAFVGIFNFISDFGINSTLNRDLIKEDQNTNTLLGTGLVIKLFGGIIAMIASILSANYLIKDNSEIKKLIFVYSFIFILYAPNVIQIFFQSKVESKFNTYSQIFSLIISGLIKIYIILTQKSAIYLIITYLLDLVWINIAMFYFYNKKYNTYYWRFDLKTAKKIILDSWPLMFSAAAVYIYLRVDQVIIGSLMDKTAVGFYAAAVKIAEVLYFIPGIICTSLFPAIINSKKHNNDVYKKRMYNLYILMLSLSITISLPITFFSKKIIEVLFGPEYFPAAQILSIYTWSSIGMFLSTAINQYLITENRASTIFLLNLSGMLINIVLNFILIPKIGLNGAAYATLFSYLITPTIILLIEKFNNQNQKLLHKHSL